MYYGASAHFKTLSTVTTPATALLPGASRGASPFDLTTVSAVETELGVESSAQNNAYFQRVITACSLKMAQHCKRSFAIQTYQDTIFPLRDPPFRIATGGLDPVQTAQRPLISGSVTVTENGTTLVENTNYVVDYALGQITRYDPNDYPIPFDEWMIVVQYKAGFAPSAPDFSILADAAIEFVKFRYFARFRDPGLKSENVVGVYEAAYLWGTGPGGPLDIPGPVAEMIERYRVPTIG